jgi:murein DD-endopeptidase MepM/ murein hydrolase activator NlpD
MHVIIMSDHLVHRSRSYHVKRRHGLAAAVLLTATFALTGLMGYYLATGGPETKAASQRASSEQVDQLALRIGELQARQEQLSTSVESISQKAGVPLPQALKAAPGRGGLPPGQPAASLAPKDLEAVMNQLSERLELASDQLLVLEAEQQRRQTKQGKVKLDEPVMPTSHLTSIFGARIDPFTGQLTRHAGLDFADAPGSPILAAESGVVLDAQMHPQYGYMVEIDHGKGMSTRYAHLSKILVTKGAIIKRGQQIAEMGSTGRSTGPHLHFEVLKQGVQQNPMLYLYGRS